MIRTSLAVIAGAALWAALCLTINFGVISLMPDAFDAAGVTRDTGLLIDFLVLSVVYSLAAGYLTGRLGRNMRGVYVLGGIQLAIGVLVQASYWEVMPLWYHLPFLALLVPGIVVGGRISQRAAVRRLAGSAS